MISENVWFSHREKRWKINWYGKFSWKKKQEIWDFDNCKVSLARSKNNEMIVVVRSVKEMESSYVDEKIGDKKIDLRFMLGFKIDKIPNPPILESSYVSRKNLEKERREGPRDRYIVQIDENHWIWEWVQEGKDLKEYKVNEIYFMIKDEVEKLQMNQSTIRNDNIFDVDIDIKDDEIIPVIYQPAIDARKNFIREIHSKKGTPNPDGSFDVDVSIVFENERLRKNGVLNSIYESVRRVIYRRTKDLESFKIKVRNDVEKNAFTFENIYSNEHKMNDDSIHGDKKPPIPEHEIRYYFMNHKHPIVFVNTSNHAMAEHDANNRLWKWEYACVTKKSPVYFGNKSKDELDKELREY